MGIYRRAESGGSTISTETGGGFRSLLTAPHDAILNSSLR